MPSPSAVRIELSGGEREQLESWCRRYARAQVLALRWRVVPPASEGLSSSEVATRMGIKTLETTPSDATDWSTRSLEREVGLTQPAVRRI
jgi:hypothetical protein